MRGASSKASALCRNQASGQQAATVLHQPRESDCEIQLHQQSDCWCKRLQADNREPPARKGSRDSGNLGLCFSSSGTDQMHGCPTAWLPGRLLGRHCWLCESLRTPTSNNDPLHQPRLAQAVQPSFSCSNSNLVLAVCDECCSPQTPSCMVPPS